MKCPLCQDPIPQTVMDSIRNNTVPALRLYAANSASSFRGAFKNVHEILLKKNKQLTEKECTLKRKLEEIEKENHAKVFYFVT